MAIGSDLSYTFTSKGPGPQPNATTGKSRPDVNGSIKGSWLVIGAFLRETW